LMMAAMVLVMAVPAFARGGAGFYPMVGGPYEGTPVGGEGGGSGRGGGCGTGPFGNGGGGGVYCS